MNKFNNRRIRIRIRIGQGSKLANSHDLIVPWMPNAKCQMHSSLYLISFYASHFNPLRPPPPAPPFSFRQCKPDVSTLAHIQDSILQKSVHTSKKRPPPQVGLFSDPVSSARQMMMMMMDGSHRLHASSPFLINQTPVFLSPPLLSLTHTST